MKKLIAFLFILFLIPSLCFGQIVRGQHGGVVGVGGGGCNPATNEVGTRTLLTDSDELATSTPFASYLRRIVQAH